MAGSGNSKCLCTVLEVSCCSGFTLFCCACAKELKAPSSSSSTTISCFECGTICKESYKVVIRATCHVGGNCSQVVLCGNSLNQLLGVPPFTLHHYLLQHDFPSKSVSEALQHMLVGQCALVTYSGSWDSRVIAASIEIVGGNGCHTILSYPPFSSVTHSLPHRSPMTLATSSFFSESLVTPTKLDCSSSPCQDLQTPELFGNCSSKEVLSHTTPSSSKRLAYKLSYNDVALTPDIL